MLTCSNLAQAKLVIDRAVASDSTFPTQTVYLAKSPDVSRNIRYSLFDNAIFDTRLRGNYSMQRTNAEPSYYFGAILGLESGWGNPYVIGSASFVPGALADNLTSKGGYIFEPNDHFNILKFLTLGVAGCYGTVIEPCAYLGKFPSPQNYLYQARGFSMAECYYQSVTNPYQGLLLGEPLAAPFALPSTGSWIGLPADCSPERHDQSLPSVHCRRCQSSGPAGGPVCGRHLRPDAHEHPAPDQQCPLRHDQRLPHELHGAG